MMSEKNERSQAALAAYSADSEDASSTHGFTALFDSDSDHSDTTGNDTDRVEVAESHVNSVIAHIDHVAAQGFTRSRVFRDWIDLMLASLQGDEELYEQTIERYVEQSRFETTDDRHPVSQLSDAMGSVLAARTIPCYDILGEVYMRVGEQSDELGQHFTPHSVSDMMAVSTVTGDDGTPPNADSPETGPEVPGLSGVSIADPACGSGRLLLSVASVFSDRYPEQDFWVHGVDLDGVCAKMAVLNLFLHNVDGVVVHGDSLQVTTHQAWVVRNSSMIPIQELSTDPRE